MNLQKIKLLNKKNTNFTIVSGCIIWKNDQVLLIKEPDDDFWKFPGGVGKDNESPRQTATREVREETGLKIAVRENPIFFWQELNKESKTKYYLLIHYPVEYSADFPIITQKGSICKWFNFARLPIKIAPNIQPVLNQFKKIKIK